MLWYEKNRENKARFVLEVHAMQESYPHFRLHKTTQGDLYWEGQLKTQIKDAQGNIKFHGNAFDIKVEYPTSYPDYPPTVYVLRPKFPADTPHLRDRSAQQLCLYHPDYAKKQGIYNPSLSTVVNILGHTMNWLIAFEIWHTTKKWIVPESPTN